MLYFNLDWLEPTWGDLYGSIYTLQIVNPFKPTEPKAYDVSLVYWTSTDATLVDVAYARKTYQLTLDGNPSTWYYLDADDISPAPLNGYYGFYLTPPPTKNTAFWNYWAAKGVPPATEDGSWQYYMYGILQGYLPMFILKVHDGDYVLLDGLQFALYCYTYWPDDPNDIPELPLRLNGDYPAGTYTFVGDMGYPLNRLDGEANPYLNGFDGYSVALQIK